MTNSFHTKGNWKTAPLSKCVDILDKLRIPINSKERQNRILGKSISELYPYYGATGQTGWIDNYIFDEELVLLGEDGAPFLDGNKDKAYIVKGKYWVNNHAHVLRGKEGIISNSFLMHYLNYFNYQGYVTGTTRLKLNQSRMKSIPLLVPPLDIQNIIVAKIEELFSQLDAGVAGLKRAQAKLINYRSSRLKNAVNGNQLTTKKKGISETSKEWQKTRIRNIATKGKNSIKRGPFGSSVKKAYFVPKGYKIYQQRNVIDNDFTYGDYYIDSERFTKLKDFEITPGDILITGAGTIGKIAVVPENIEPGIMNQALLKISLNPKLINTDFFLYFFEVKAREYLLAKTRGSAMKNISSVRDLREMEILLPTLDEQKKIVEEVERQLTIINEIKDMFEITITRSSNLRYSILKSAFEGKLI